MVNVVLACCKNGGIGINNKLPWNIKDELQMFKIITNNATIIMGYNTWSSLPKKPLLNRINVVLTRSKEKKEEWVENYFIQGSAYCEMYEERFSQAIEQVVILIVTEDGAVQTFVKDKKDYLPLLEMAIKDFNETNN